MSASLDQVFRALAEGNRRQLLEELLVSNGQTLGQLCDHLQITRQAVTRHLALLEEADLVSVVWRGREKIHYLNTAPLRETAADWMARFERAPVGKGD